MWGALFLCVPSGTQERSQLKNKEVAMKLLRSKLYTLKLDEQNAAISGNRKMQVGSGARSEKIRTYNWKDSRCTDHRLGQNVPLQTALDGDLDGLIQSCMLKEQEDSLREMMAQQGK